MFRIFILTDEKYVNDSFPSNAFFQVEIPCLVKMSWSIKQIVCLVLTNAELKRYSMHFSKVHMPELKTSWMYVQMA